MYGGRNKNDVPILILIILMGMVIGGFIGEYLGSFAFTEWLRYGLDFGTDSPLSINLGIIKFQFGISIKFSVAGILGVIASVFIYRRLR